MLFWRIMQDGGIIMWLILLCSGTALFIFIDRWFHFHREQVNVGELVAGLINVLRRNGLVEAITLCDNTPGPAARIMLAIILAYQRGEEDLREIVEDAASLEVPQLEKRLNLLATIAYITPLLGLLGTVVGMMGAFQELQRRGAYITAADLSGDIGVALLTTAGGLCVAIPCYIAYNYLVSRVESMTVDMEKASSEILYFLKKHGKGQAQDDEPNQDQLPIETEDN